MRMLIVDDSRTMRNFLDVAAKDLDFETEQAVDGEEALEVLAASEPFDVALFDWDMPRRNGISLLNAVRAEKRFDPMKIVMVTSQSSFEAVSRALASGADDFLMKPLTPAMLADKIRLLGMID